MGASVATRMSPQVYHALHITGIIMLFMGYGALLARSMVRNDSSKLKRLASITSGIGLVLIFVAGFGLMAKLYNNSFQSWMLVKIVIWLVLGGIIVLINRVPALAKLLWWVIIAMGALAAYMVYMRPV